MTVVYDPTNPIRASIAGFLDVWLPSAAAFGVTILFGGCVLLSRWLRRRKARFTRPEPVGAEGRDRTSL